MSTKVARNHQLLKRRIEDFFDSRCERQAARELINSLAVHSHTWIFGGMIRDIGLYGRKGFSSDIDIVVDSTRDDLTHLMIRLGIEHVAHTKLGGIRFRHHEVDFDVWCLSDTWAFRENLIPLEDAQSLLKTTLMTWDAVLYDVNARQIISPENYLDDLLERRLELVLSDTPNEAGSLIKILRTIYNKHVELLGPALCHFLLQRLHEYRPATLLQYELKHYNTHSFTEGQIEHLFATLLNAAPGQDLPVDSTAQMALHFNDKS